ncbi:MAG: polysaccharide deacetylase family protein [candidate division WOR-3 bacterium]
MKKSNRKSQNSKLKTLRLFGLAFCFLLFGFYSLTFAQEKGMLDSLPLAGHKVILTIDDGYSSVYHNVYPLLKRYKMSATLGLIVNSLNPNWSGYENSTGFLTYAQVKEMIDSCGVEIASHTLSHPWLTRLDSAKVWEEISRSKVILESIFQVPVITFIYPYGDMDSRIVKMLRPAGYLLARAVRSGEVNFWVDPYRLPEFELRRETSLETVKSYILRNPVSILLLHRVVAEPKVFTEWSKDDFAELLNWLHNNGARCISLAELYYDWRQELLGWMIREQKGWSNLCAPDAVPNPHGDGLLPRFGSQ